MEEFSGNENYLKSKIRWYERSPVASPLGNESVTFRIFHCKEEFPGNENYFESKIHWYERSPVARPLY